uniref:Reverse transcriptase domain-containing protein n=1 Tax=Callorhinchus milii TaxID=7868 RepID=A0A4W3I0M1_CALMI
MVLGKLSGLKTDKSPGPDGRHPRVLKEMATEIVDGLSLIFQNSLDSGMILIDWKIANLTPLFKKGGREKMGNYRPVSLTSVVGKILESLIKDVVMGFPEDHNKIRQSQHGFTKGKSCLNNLLEFFEDVSSRLERGEPVDVVYLDFKKAFDKVPHKRLLHKVKAHGINGNILAWIEEWLTGRKQRVGINGSFTNWQDVTNGVPQGSVFGSQLFTIYINDLDEDIECNVSKFADDTKLGGRVSSEDDAERLQRDIDRRGEWASRWQMAFNVGKCEVIHLGSKNRKTDYFLDGERLDSVSVQRDLGVLVHQSQKVSLQVQQATKKANGMLAFIAKGLEYKSREVLLQL